MGSMPDAEAATQKKQKCIPWNEGFAMLKAYQEKNGHCKVSQKDNDVLYCWLSNNIFVLRKLKSSFAKKTRIARLNSLGVDWGMNPPLHCVRSETAVTNLSGTLPTWDRSFIGLQAFQEREGHCNVSIADNPELFHWSYHQKLLLHTQADSLEKRSRIARLKSIGFKLGESPPLSRYPDSIANK
jgi:hypothetical protein